MPIQLQKGRGAQASNLAIAVAVLLLCGTLPSHAQQKPVPPMALPPRAEPVDTDELEARRAANAVELQQLQRDAELSQERITALESEIKALEKDRLTLTARLIQTAKSEKKLAQDIEDTAGRLAGLRQQEDAMRQSLRARRDTLSEVLGGLLRMGRNPPPALLVRPDDALASVRSAIVLGSVVPELRDQTERLANDLAQLRRIVSAANTERETLSASLQNQAVEKQRLARLLEAKASLRGDAVAQSDAEKARAAELASRSGSLQELITGLQSQIDGVRQAALDAERAEQERIRAGLERASRLSPADTRIAAALPFSAMTGKLDLPAVGTFLHRFGSTDELGHKTLGDTIQTQSGAIVTALTDSTVLYAGPFRTYGQLLILDAGEDYHIVLAGMNQVSVEQGQSVLAGEPVGFMGEQRIASAAFEGNANSAPTLYVEIRKARQPVNPDPWWSDRATGRKQDDS